MFKWGDLIMLYILIDNGEVDTSGYESRTSEYFNVVFKKDWLKDEFNRRALKVIDNVDIIADELLHNELLGFLTPRELSTGVKTLMLVNTLNMKVNGARMGDNCYPLLCELADKKDVYIRLKHMPELDGTLNAYIINTKKYTKNWSDYTSAFLEVLYGCKY